MLHTPASLSPAARPSRRLPFVPPSPASPTAAKAAATAPASMAATAPAVPTPRRASATLAVVLGLGLALGLCLAPPSAGAAGAIAGPGAGGTSAGRVDLALALPIAQAAGPGQMVQDPDLGSEAELVRFTDELFPTLMQLPRNQKVRIADWPVAPGVRKDVIIARHEIYAPTARILEVGTAGTREVPRSRLTFFWGVEAADPHSGVFAAIDPVAGTIESMTESGGVRYQLSALEPAKPGLHLLATAQAFVDRATGGRKLHWSCGNENLLQLPGVAPSSALPSAAPALPAASDPLSGIERQAAAAQDDGPLANGSPYNLMTVAVDTDHEFFSFKFAGAANPASAATDYIAMMFAEINVMYERDLQTDLLIGTTILRTTAAGDPYIQGPSGGAASPAELTEFSDYWAANEGSVSRTVAVLLSGKSPESNEASGIAWYTGTVQPSPLCDKSFGYSVEQLFTFAANSSSLPGDTLILGHEIGHNFGTRHTHCYTPPIDQCYNLETGCYSGPVSCPAPTTVAGVTGVEGTVMSYCQIGLIAGCTATQVFGPVVLAAIKPNLQAALGNNPALDQCITAAVVGPQVTGISPNSGTTAGGTRVTVTGSGFQSGATVTVGGVAATSVNVVSSTMLTAVTGAHATGTVSVVVTSNSVAATLANSYFYTPPPAAAGFYTVSPCRMIDTRNATGAYGGPALAASASRTFLAAGQCGIPPSATAISVNVTATATTAPGFYALYPGNGFPFGTSALSFGASQTIAGATIVELATDGSGTFGVWNGSAGSAQFLLDVNGYFK
jgi:hypothetical protein